MAKSIEWVTYSQVFAFLGNSLLSPMKQTSDAGMDPAFWAAFPDFGDDAVALACKRCGEAASEVVAHGMREDHIGLELLYLSELCRRRAEEATGCLVDDGVCGDEAVRAFIESHPLGWVEALRSAVQESHPQGYIDGILGVAEASLTSLSADLR